MKRKRYQPTWHQKLLFLSALALVVLPVFTGWIGDIIKSWWLNNQDWAGGHPLLVAFFCLIAVVLSLYMVVLLSKVLLRVEIQPVPVTPHTAVITLLSNQSNPSRVSDGSWKFGDQSLPATLDEICGAAEIPGFKWQQNLRAARHHRQNLKWLCLLGSSGANGSARNLDVAEQLFRHYLPGIEIVTPLRGDLAPDFEDLRQTCDVLRMLVDECRYDERDIVIDITGGQKTASVAAALVTLDRHDLMFQYVGTQEHAGKILGFEAKTLQQKGG